MASQFIPPFVQYFGTDGLPLAGGKVYTYDSGTTTPRATYSDALSTSTNANPVILDSHGRASIFLTSATAYRIVVKTAADVTISTTDNVYASSEDIGLGWTLSADLDVNGYSIISTGDGDINITPHGTGVTKIYDPKLINNLNANTYDIQTATGKGVVSPTTGVNLLMFTDAASAVNYIEVSSNISSSRAFIEAKGTDTNVGITLLPKGTGTVNIGARWSDLSLDDLGSYNYNAIATYSSTNPDVLATGGMLSYYGFGADAPTRTNLIFYHSSGTPTIVRSQNVTSLTDNGTGDTTINFTTSYSNAYYYPSAPTNDAVGVSFRDPTTATLRTLTWSQAAGVFTLADTATETHVTILGAL